MVSRPRTGPHPPPQRDAAASVVWIGVGASLVGVVLGATAVYLGMRDPAVPPEARSSASSATPAALATNPEGPPREGDPPAVAGSLVAAVEATRDSVVNLETPRGLGAGVIVDPSGVVLTNYHVIADALAPTPALFGADEQTSARLIARFANERRIEAEVVIADPEEDLAVLRLVQSPDTPLDQPERFAPARLGKSEALMVGQDVFAVGNPFGYPHTVSSGIVSALDRTGVLDNSAASLIQLDASINLGNSGGPLFNLDGELVGIVTARSRQAQGIAFALPIDHVSGFLRAMADPSATRAGIIGVKLSLETPLSDGARDLGYRAGLHIDEVVKDKTGEAAGLRKNDIIVALRGKRLDGLVDADASEVLAEHLQTTVRALFPGETLDMTIVRGAEALEVSVEVGSASAREQVLIDAEDVLGLRLDPAAQIPTIGSIAVTSPLRRYEKILEGAALVRVMGRTTGDFETLGGTLDELRRHAASRGLKPRVRLGFRDPSGREGDILIELQSR